jgi:hypothetical protein
MFGSILFLAAVLADPSECEALARLTLPNTTITSAWWMDAGPMAAPGTQGAGPAEAGGAQRATPPPLVLPAHCRVAIVMRPSSDSHPQVARYTGIGSTNDAQNFVCAAK